MSSSVQPGLRVKWRERTWIVDDLRDLNTAFIRPVNGKRSRLAPIDELGPAEAYEPQRPIQGQEDHEWKAALHVYNVLEPLIKQASHTRLVSDVDRAAQSLKKSRSTIYNYLKAYQVSRRLSVFFRKQRSDKGTSTLDPKVQTIIERSIKKYFLVREQPSKSIVYDNVKAICTRLGLKTPAMRTISRCIGKLPLYDVDKARLGKKAAENKHRRSKGHFPGAAEPFSVFQMDGTPVDVIIVDEENRKAIKRPYLTLVMDVCTRMIAGLSLSLETESATEAAICLHHAILPKAKWLKKIGLPKDSWEFFGKPSKIFVDNGSAFRSKAMIRGCQEYDIILEFRPKGLPHFGGNIERALGTFMRMVHNLPGSTFSNVVLKADYDSEKLAVMTLKELEKWLTIFITKVYHQDRHSETGFAPSKLYHKHQVGDEDTCGIGTQLPIADERRLLLDFLPHSWKDITANGIKHDHITYFNDRLRRWVGTTEAGSETKKQKFLVASDPRDISFVYFFDPELNEYLNVEWTKDFLPMSRWDHAKILSHVKKDEHNKIDEESIFAGQRQMQRIKELAEAETRSKKGRSSRKTKPSVAKKSRLQKSREQQWKESEATLRPKTKAQIAAAKQEEDGEDENADENEAGEKSTGAAKFKFRIRVDE